MSSFATIFSGKGEPLGREPCLVGASPADPGENACSFEDGFPNLFINNVKGVAGRHVLFLANFYPVDLIYPQLAILYQLPR